MLRELQAFASFRDEGRVLSHLFGSAVPGRILDIFPGFDLRIDGYKLRIDGYKAAIAVASSGDIVAYFATPTMVKTLLKCGVSPKIPTE